MAEPSLTFLEHTLATAEIFTGAYESGLEVLEVQTEPACWRTVSTGMTWETLKPDLFLEVAEDDLIHSWFIEVDRGTEWQPALRRKAERYLTAYRHGFVDEDDPSTFPRVLWLVPDDRRREFVTKAVAVKGAVDGVFEVAVKPGLGS